MLDVDVVCAGSLGLVLVGGDPRHNVHGRELLRAGGDREKGKDEGSGETHGREYVVGSAKFRCWVRVLAA